MRSAWIALAIAACSPDPVPRELPPPHEDEVVHFEPPIVSNMNPDGTSAQQLLLDADSFEREARELRDTGVLERTRDLLVKLQASPQYHNKQRLDPELLTHAVSIANALADRFERGARRLRERDIANGLEEVSRGVDAALKDSFGELPSQIVDELAYVRDELCKGKPCTHTAELGDAFDLATELRSGPAVMVRFAAASLERLAPDPHTRTVIDRITGKGPANGEVCGNEGLCKAGLQCRVETSTCESTCEEAAMQPCTGQLRCIEIAGLPDRVCRP